MRTGLAFSGGKDSWACLWLNIHRIEQIDVIWVNTGKYFPELLETVDYARSLCPRFHEVRTDREAQNDRFGIPAEVVPVDWTAAGQLCSGKKSVTVQSYLQCCLENISLPLHNKAKELGVTELIRGQRNEDDKRGACRDGDCVDGIVYRHPIEDWTTGQVLSFVGENMPLPDHFRLKHSSMDCFDCTAYKRDSVDRIDFMRTTHPTMYREYERRAQDLVYALSEAMK